MSSMAYASRPGPGPSGHWRALPTTDQHALPAACFAPAHAMHSASRPFAADTHCRLEKVPLALFKPHSPQTRDGCASGYTGTVTAFGPGRDGDERTLWPGEEMDIPVHLPRHWWR